MADEPEVSTEEQPQTMEERVENLFTQDMDEPEEALSDPEQEAKPPEDEDVTGEEPDELDEVDPEPKVEGDDLVEFEWDGQLLEAPPAIKEALMRQQDYTQKTQDIAAERKAFEVQVGTIEQREQKASFIESAMPDLLKAQQLEAQAEQTHQYLRDNIDSLSATEIEKIRMSIEDSRTERDKLVQSLTSKQNEFQQAQEQTHTELLNKGTEVLRSRIPGWGKESQEQVREYAMQSGYTEAEIQGVVDPRQVETLWKASQYDALQQGKVAAVKKVTGTPKIQPKSRNPMPENVKSKLKLRKTLKNPKLSSKDKARAIQKNFGERFG